MPGDGITCGTLRLRCHRDCTHRPEASCLCVSLFPGARTSLSCFQRGRRKVCSPEFVRRVARVSALLEALLMHLWCFQRGAACKMNSL